MDMNNILRAMRALLIITLVLFLIWLSRPITIHHFLTSKGIDIEAMVFEEMSASGVADGSSFGYELHESKVIRASIEGELDNLLRRDLIREVQYKLFGTVTYKRSNVNVSSMYITGDYEGLHMEVKLYDGKYMLVILIDEAMNEKIFHLKLTEPIEMMVI